MADQPTNTSSGVEADDPALHALLKYLREQRGFDFTGYKPSSLTRRICRRIQEVRVADVRSYIEYLELHPEEFTLLFNTILINVTSFFRDPDAWQVLAGDILPALIAEQGNECAFRAWSAGCASGQEAYSLAMLLVEQMGLDQYKERVRIYATDVDESALTEARHGRYTANQVSSLPDELAAKYLARSGDHFVVAPELRRQVIFGRNDLVQDAPISHVRILICRNTLMYLNSDTQESILRRFAFALEPHGVLFLGKAEMLIAQSEQFAPLAVRHRIYGRKQGAPSVYATALPAVQRLERPLRAVAVDRHLREAAFDMSPAAQLVISRNGHLAAANREARRLLGLRAPDAGRPFHELQASYRPVDLRGPIHTVLEEGEPVSLDGIRHVVDGKERSYEARVAPVASIEEQLAGVTVVMLDVTRHRQLSSALRQANADLETAHEAQQSTNEELETTNEELQSTAEELETTNEELQSSNEELETTNEELHAGNEELETMNEELRERTNELGYSAMFLAAILESISAGLAVLDAQMNILSWNDAATDLWGLREDEVLGRPMLDLDTGLPVEALREPLLRVQSGLADREHLEIESVNRRGRAFVCGVAISPFRGPNGVRQGVVVLMEDLP